MKTRKIKDLILDCKCGFTHRWEHGKPGDPSMDNSQHTPTPFNPKPLAGHKGGNSHER